MREDFGLNRRSLLLAGFGAAANCWKVLQARDTEFWNHKEPSDWTTDEVDRLITKSPWAKEVSVTEAGGGHSGGSYPGSRGGMGGGGRGGGIGVGIPGVGGLGIPGMGGGHGGHSGGHGGGQHSGPQVKLYVRWESAKPVLEALQQPLPKAFAGHYVISINGIPLSETHNRDGEGDEEDVADRLKSLTYLEANDKSVQPGLGQRSPAAASSSFFFGFSKDLVTLSADDGDVHFTSRVGHLQVKAKFTLSEMVYRGHLAV